MLPGMGAGACGAEGALAGAGSVPWSWWEGKGSCAGWELAVICRLHEMWFL